MRFRPHVLVLTCTVWKQIKGLLIIFSDALDLPTTLVLVLKEMFQCCLRLSPSGRACIGFKTNVPMKSLFSASLSVLQANMVLVFMYCIKEQGWCSIWCFYFYVPACLDITCIFNIIHTYICNLTYLGFHLMGPYPCWSSHFHLYASLVIFTWALTLGSVLCSSLGSKHLK